MRERLELKILAVVLILLIAGIMAAGIMVMTIEKKSLYSITETSLESTANIIAQDISRTMLEGKADSTKSMMQEFQGMKGVEQLIVLHYDGHQVFSDNASVNESGVMKNLSETKRPFSVSEGKSVIFYKPLLNEDRCKTCHANDPAVLGAIKISLSIAKQYDRAVMVIILVITVTVIASILFCSVLWYMIRRMVIRPVKAVEDAAQKLAEGDMSFNVEINSEDEIGRASNAIKISMFSLSDILKRIKDITRRVNHLVKDVEDESKKVIEGAVIETEAITNISSSVEEMNAAISDIADGTEGLAASAEETAASMEQMVTSIAEISNSTNDLSAAVEATSASIEELSATIKEVASNASELASSAQETQSAISEISVAVREVELRSRESAALSEQVKKDAKTLGMTSIEKTINGMRDIKASVEKTAEYMQKLGGRSDEIGKILNVIDDITDQTTLLALNAAILAAQAGEHGKGFSVVADEIKQLADRTSVSTKEIAELIQSVQQEVSDAIEAMKDGLKSVEIGFKVSNEAVDALRKIVESSTKSSEMSAAIERSTTEQSKAVALVSEAMEKVLSMVGQIAKATTEQSKGIQLIMHATEKMHDIAKHVRTATNEQTVNSRQVSQAIEIVSDKSQQISRAINEQKIGSNQIWASIEKIKDIPKDNRDRSFKMNLMVRELHKDVELVSTEMERFKFAGGEMVAGVLRMGVVPLESPAVMFKNFAPLAEYIGKALNRRIDLKVAVDFQTAIKDLEQGITQFSFFTPSTYIESHEKFGAKVLVKALNEGKPFHHSVIITRDNSGINTLADVRGRSFAFGDIHSTSSHIVPRAMLLSEGIELKDLQYYNYLGHHNDVIKAVSKGDFDAGAVMESLALKYKDAGIKLLRYSEEIAEFNITVSKNLDDDTVARIKHAMLVLSDADATTKTILKSINDSYTGFVEAEDKDYDNVRHMMKKIGLL